jgi:hypothetical protein
MEMTTHRESFETDCLFAILTAMVHFDTDGHSGYPLLFSAFSKFSLSRTHDDMGLKSLP